MTRDLADGSYCRDLKITDGTARSTMTEIERLRKQRSLDIAQFLEEVKNEYKKLGECERKSLRNWKPSPSWYVNVRSGRALKWLQVVLMARALDYLPEDIISFSRIVDALRPGECFAATDCVTVDGELAAGYYVDVLETILPSALEEIIFSDVPVTGVFSESLLPKMFMAKGYKTIHYKTRQMRQHRRTALVNIIVKEEIESFLDDLEFCEAEELLHSVSGFHTAGSLQLFWVTRVQACQARLGDSATLGFLRSGDTPKKNIVIQRSVHNRNQIGWSHCLRHVDTVEARLKRLQEIARPADESWLKSLLKCSKRSK